MGFELSEFVSLPQNLFLLCQLGIELFSDDFFRVDAASPAVQLQRRTKVWHTPEFTLEQVVAGVPWQRERTIA